VSYLRVSFMKILNGFRLNFVLRVAEVLNSVHRTEFQKSREYNVSETGSVSVIRREETPTLLGSLERAKHSHWATDVVHHRQNSLLTYLRS
jgi:hypothetical protein